MSLNKVATYLKNRKLIPKYRSWKHCDESTKQKVAQKTMGDKSFGGGGGVN